MDVLTDDLYTPGGYMRAITPKTKEPTYKIKLNVSTSLQKASFFKVLNEMFSNLQKKTGKRAYSHFKKLDLTPLLE